MGVEEARPKIRLVVTDLDNTLWDWFDAWHASFSTLIKTTAELSGVRVDVLMEESRLVHQWRGTTEYSYLLNELPSLRALARDSDALSLYDEAVHQQNRLRKEHTRLYPQVRETLSFLQQMNVPVAGYTESVSYWTEWRLKTLSLDGVLAALYSSPDHDLPEGVDVTDMRMRPPEDYGLKLTPHEHVARGVEKPSPAVLNEIIAAFDVQPEETVYIGDSLVKDVAMAQAVGAHDVYALYGKAQHLEGYDLLKKVTHWTDEMVARESEATSRTGVVSPSRTASEGFYELTSMFDFRGNRRGGVLP